MGAVYKAEDTKLHRTVALKFPLKQEPEIRERFLREAQAAAALHHPNICTLFEIDEEHGFLAMELVEGSSLKEKIAERPLKLEEALDLAIEIAQGLQAAHEKGIVHRDIKPPTFSSPLRASPRLPISDWLHWPTSRGSLKQV
ncbi:MAG: serine/threonine protein kinase [Acidobacteriia bacterium]|nr:serine/threonine protein kinase [Terriglobia bacterium]